MIEPPERKHAPRASSQRRSTMECIPGAIVSSTSRQSSIGARSPNHLNAPTTRWRPDSLVAALDNRQRQVESGLRQAPVLHFGEAAELTPLRLRQPAGLQPSWPFDRSPDRSPKALGTTLDNLATAGNASIFPTRSCCQSSQAAAAFAGRSKSSQPGAHPVAAWRISPRSYVQVAIIFASALLRWPGCMVEALRVARRVRGSFVRSASGIHRRALAQRNHVPPQFDEPGSRFLLSDDRRCAAAIRLLSQPARLHHVAGSFCGFSLRTRPMDDVRLDPAIAAGRGARTCFDGSPFLFQLFVFPETDDQSVRGGSPFRGRGRTRPCRLWRDAFDYYLAKLAALNPGRAAAAEESGAQCANTSAAGLVPGAKFIHIHRDPSAVFHSMRKFYHSMLPILALQDYRPAEIDSHILWAYPKVMNRLLDALAELPPGHAMAVRYDELVADLRIR